MKKSFLTMPLWRFIADVYLPQKIRVTSDKTREHYQTVVSDMQHALRKTPTIADLTDEGICRVLRYLAGRSLSPHTIQQRRNYMVAIANWCAKRGIIRWWPSIERYPAPDVVPKAWTLEQLSRLWGACRDFDGMYNGVRAAYWWQAFHAICWDTGERTSAVLAIRPEWLDLDSGTLEIPGPVRKGGRKAATYTLKPETVRLVRPLAGRERTLIFDFPGCKATFYHHYTRLLKIAGLPSDRRNKPQKLRRTFASFLELNGGDATKALGHSNRKVTEQSYIDPAVVKQEPPNRLLPPIEPPDEGEAA